VVAEARKGGPRTGDGRDGDARASARPGPAQLGVEALVEVQRRGLQAAGDLVDRLVLAVDGRRDEPGAEDLPSGEAAAGGATGGNGSAPRADTAGTTGVADDLVRFWIDVVQRGLDAFASAATAPAGTAPPDAATLDLAGSAATGAVVLTAGTGRSEVWVHNGGDAAFEDVDLHCGDLRSPGGAVLPAGDVTFDPPRLALGPRSSRGVVVTARAAAPPGRYRGLVQSGAAPDSWIPLEVVILPVTGS